MQVVCFPRFKDVLLDLTRQTEEAAGSKKTDVEISWKTKSRATNEKVVSDKGKFKPKEILYVGSSSSENVGYFMGKETIKSEESIAEKCRSKRQAIMKNNQNHIQAKYCKNADCS